MLATNEDLLGPEAIEDPYTYYGRLREEDPIHWNPLYETWVITRYDDVVWFLRHPELFSSEIFLRDPHPPLPPILETDQALYEFNKHYLSPPLRKGHSRCITAWRCSSSQCRNRSCAEAGSCKIKRAKLRVSKISK